MIPALMNGHTVIPADCVTPVGIRFDPTICEDCGHVHQALAPVNGKCGHAGCESTQLKSAVPKHHWADTASNLIKGQNTGNFYLGDWLLYGMHNFGQPYLVAQKIYGAQYQTLLNIASVCRRVPISRRREMPVAFSHHEAVAALEPKIQTHFLELAAAKELTVAELRMEIRQSAKAKAVAELPQTQTSGLTAWFAEGLRLFKTEDPKTWPPERRAAFRSQWQRLSAAAEPLLK